MSRKFNIMKEFKMFEISAVDRPAQSDAKALIMKRDDYKGDKKKKKKESDAEAVAKGHGVMTVADKTGHAHTLSFYAGESLGETSYNKAKNDEYGHEHPFTIINGVVTIGETQGHTHEVNQADVTSVLGNMLNAQSLGKKEEDFMSGNKLQDSADTSVETLKADLEKVTKELELAKSISNMTDAQKAHYATLSADSKVEFLTKSSTEKDAAVTLAKYDDTYYKSADGVVYTKAQKAEADLAKKVDEMAAKLAKDEADKFDLHMQKRAESELEHMAGSIQVRAALLKAVEGIADAELRKGAIESLRAKATTFAEVSKSKGTEEVKKVHDVQDAVAKLDSLAKSHAADKGMDYYDAYDAVTKSNPELYNQAFGR
jgi:hypothetical protein